MNYRDTFHLFIDTNMLPVCLASFPLPWFGIDINFQTIF